MAGVAAHANMCARFQLPVRGERYLDGYVAHIPSSVIVSLLKKSWSHSPAGSCSRYGAAKTCQRGPKGPGCSFSKMCERQKQTCGMSAHKSRSFVQMFAGPCCVALSTIHCSHNFIDSIRPSVLVKVSCRLCRLVFSCSAQRLRCSVQVHASFQAARIGCSHSVAPTCSSLFHLDCLARVQQTRFSPIITVEPVSLCPTCWICVDGQVFQSFSDVG